jgi:hypothetical protein
MARVALASTLRDVDAAERVEAESLLRVSVSAAESLGMYWLADRARSRLGDAGPPESVFRRDGDHWELGYAGRTVRLADAKGLHDVATLLANPGVQIPAAQLVGADAAAEAGHGADEVLDDTAREAYRQRLADLEAAIDEAEAAHDAERAGVARIERDTLVDALASAYGAGRRPRRLGDANERARKAVTARIRDSLARISARHPEMGAHLREAIHTGVLCRYDQPTGSTRWRL